MFRPFSIGIGLRLNRRWEHSGIGISKINLTGSMKYSVYKCLDDKSFFLPCL